MGGIVGIVGFSIRNWRMTIGIMIFAVIGGLLALDRLPLDAEPDIPVPFVNVRVVLPGISPEDAERLLIRPLETEIKSIEGVKQIDSIAATNVAYVIIEFDISHDQDKAIRDVLEKVDRARSEFPQEAQEPVVEEVSTSTLPIITVNLWGDVPERELQKRAKDLQSRLESLPQVLEANISGERINVLEAILDPPTVESLGITYDEIALAVNRNNSLIPAGALETDSGKFNIKLPGLIENPADLADLVVRRGENNSIIRMSDIATVRSGYKDIENIARFNQRTSVSLEISKRQGENILDTALLVQEMVDNISSREDWPETINVTYSQSRSVYINDMRRELSSSIINAVILVFIVCIAALGWRSAIFVGWAIPASFLIAFFLFFVQGETINMMILFGLILSVGVLVDSAIVIIEYADRKMDEGLPRKEAFQTAGERMFWPIVSSTATTLAAFIPLLFWETITGKFMSYFPRTMIYVLTASMLMALIFLPTLGAVIGFKPKKKENSNAALLAGADGDPSKLTGFTGGYVKVIRQLIRFPLLVLLAMGILGFLIISVFGASVKGPPPKPVEFFTQTPSDQVFVLARTRGNTTAEQSLTIAKELENRLVKVDGVDSIYTVAGPGAAGGGGGGEGLNGPSNVPIDSTVRIYTELLPFNERSRPLAEIIEELEQVTTGIPGVLTEITAIDQGPPIAKDIGIQISAENREQLKSTAIYVREKLASIEGVYEIEDSLPLPGVDWEIIVDRAEAGRLGLDVGRIGAALQFVTEGALVGQYRPLNVEEEVDIRVRYPSTSRDLAQLDSLRIQTPQGALPISSVVKRVAKPRQDKIERRDLLPFYVVQGNTRKDYATNLQVEELQKWFDEEAELPPGTQIKFLGQAEENAAAAQFGKNAAMAIMFMMGVILLLQFNSFYHVFLTLSAVVLSVFGVILGLTFYPYISMILVLTGVIALAGIVVNNNIVLIDTYQRLLSNGFSPEDAALRTAAQRLRPVILTTLTTVVGLMPLVLGWQANIFTGEFSTRGSSTSDIWAPISYVVSSGLGFATILTLIVTPVMLAMPTVMKKRLLKLFGKKTDTNMKPEDDADPSLAIDDAQPIAAE
ncbi:efflux RND transporter permease subunit [Hellea balneolensis]|uniref:efflux RND transporter permease subunit n=1 Tax=Hellea balneolensis TaxID=287478 RepID=UPI00041FA43C|nr:efflux RND transporter permease subunit [Hellea balneolensis]